MMGVTALTVIRQYLDDATLVDATVTAAFHH